MGKGAGTGWRFWEGGAWWVCINIMNWVGMGGVGGGTENASTAEMVFLYNRQGKIGKTKTGSKAVLD